MPLGCGCLLLLGAGIAPRLALVFTWIFTPYVSRAFDGVLMPLLGILLLPWTTIAYILLYTPGVGVTGFEWFFVGLAFMVDLASYADGGRRSYQQQPVRY